MKIYITYIGNLISAEIEVRERTNSTESVALYASNLIVI